MILRHTVTDKNKTGTNLILGKEYLVIEITFSKDMGGLLYRIYDEQSTPGLYSHRLFDVVNSALPPNWKFETNNKEVFDLAPEPFFKFSKNSFWESYFSDDVSIKDSAKQVFEIEMQKIRSFHIGGREKEV